jgi:hypothetical protein
MERVGYVVVGAFVFGLLGSLFGEVGFVVGLIIGIVAGLNAETKTGMSTPGTPPPKREPAPSKTTSSNNQDGLHTLGTNNVFIKVVHPRPGRSIKCQSGHAKCSKLKSSH